MTYDNGHLTRDLKYLHDLCVVLLPHEKIYLK